MGNLSSLEHRHHSPASDKVMPSISIHENQVLFFKPGDRGLSLYTKSTLFQNESSDEENTFASESHARLAVYQK